MYNTKFIDIYDLHAKFHVPCSNGSSGIFMKDSKY